jgi:hypothetical protein
MSLPYRQFNFCGNRSLLKKSLLVLSLINLPIFADQYLLVMSKDDGLCHRVNNIVSDDLRNYKELRLQTHEEFSAIKWDKKFEYIYYKDGKRMVDKFQGSCEVATGCKNAIFDINNDGKDELVSFTKETYGGAPGFNSIKFAAQDPKEPPMTFSSHNVLKSIGYKWRKYKELPTQGLKYGYGNEGYISSAGDVTLRPFRVNKIYYLATFFSVGQEDHEALEKLRGEDIAYYKYTRSLWQDINYQNFVAVSRYDADNNPTDLCYFIKIFTNKNYKIED